MAENPSASRVDDADEIDYFLNLEDAGQKSMSATSPPSLAVRWPSLRAHCITASSLVLFYYASLPLKRMSYLLTTKPELQNDGRWPEEQQEKGATAGGVARGFPIQQAFLHIYRTEGVCGFFRGACLSAPLAIFAKVEDLAVLALLQRLTKIVAPPSSYDSSFPVLKKEGMWGLLDSKSFASMFWWVLVPAVAWAVRWPLRSFRTILLTTYMAGGIAEVREPGTADAEAQRDEGGDAKSRVPAVATVGRPRCDYCKYAQLWKHIRTDCSWTDILRNGWEVDLLDHVTGIGLGKLTQVCVTLALGAERLSLGLAPWFWLSPRATCTLLRVLLSVAMSTLVLTIRQPLLVVSRRMALLSMPRRVAEQSRTEKSGRSSTAGVNWPVKEERRYHTQRASGLRYYNSWSCVSHIFQHEGWRSLFSGLCFNLMVQLALLGSTLVQQHLSMYSASRKHAKQ